MVNNTGSRKMRVLKKGVSTLCRGCWRIFAFFDYFLPSRLNFTHFVLFVIFMPAVYYQYRYNAIDYVLSLPFYFFTYPLDIDMPALVDKVLKGENPGAEPINFDDFPFVLDNDKMCKSAEGADETIFLLFMIKSAMNNTEQRNTIRRTWAQEYNVPGVIVKHMFVLGVHPGDMKLQQRVGQEHEQWEDIAQGYFNDTYYNNTIKLMMAFHWATSKCKVHNEIQCATMWSFVAINNL